ncbi:MAG: homoserine dehydrogenase [Clostridiales bacterium]|nr:homoserine dehydrogenase [Clostridiales bacterium]
MKTDIAILGFGVVGAGTAKVLEMNKEQIAQRTGTEIYVKHILDLRDFPDSPFADRVTHDADEVFGDKDIKIAVETIGGARVAYEYTKRALSAGITVVTSNKELVSTHGVELLKIAKDNGCQYLYEAAVGGGIPIIRPLYRCLATNKVVRIAGIVNGTTNYILTQMKVSGISFEEALVQAQKNGFAEANPAADIDGIDAQRKLSILSTIALDGTYVAPSTINAQGISEITTDDIEFASKIGCELKLIALFENKGDKPSAYVAPTYVSKESLIASVEGVFNAIMVEGNALGESLYYGQGAGAIPTASAVCGDILEAASGDTMPESRLWEDKGAAIASYEDVKASIVVRAPEIPVTAFSEYDTVRLDGAVIVNSIAHKDIGHLIAGIPGARWMHYLK